MKGFIKLTDKSGDRVIVNYEAITVIGLFEGDTTIAFQGSKVLVKQSIDEVLIAIATERSRI